MNNNLHIKILKGLIENDGAEYYFFHTRYAIGPGELILTLNDLQSSSLIEIKSSKVFILPKGRKFLLIHKRTYLNNDEKPWLKIPEYMKGQEMYNSPDYYPLNFDLNYLKKLERE
ncbi:hypothetical protein KXQ82_09755 [Mucilaginibacter sp. HMF5004]|uniref:hypothetical protein n=1 Tax=Mucilaginibacter rivuli TaxID=2857527 RepID=UPI001C5CCFF7|nr:hypothetical protein [Mucilaginibacter rivuli]MBW4890002.1 hypothetical protein [Mucilaginibacter rivuli]